MGRNLHFTKRHSTLVILSINLPRGLTREVVLSFTRKSECLLISNNLDTFLERYSMNFIAFYCKLNTKKKDEYKQIFISNDQNLVLFLTACFIRRWISNVLDVFRLRYLIPSQSWQWVRPSFIFFLLRGIWWLHTGQILQSSCQRHFGHLMIDVMYWLKFSQWQQRFLFLYWVNVLSVSLLSVSSLSFSIMSLIPSSSSLLSSSLLFSEAISSSSPSLSDESSSVSPSLSLFYQIA